MEGFCRGCLVQYDGLDLLQYTEKNRRLFIYCTGLQVKRNDAFTFQLCKECHFNMKQSCKFKKQCRNTDRKYKNFLLKNDGENFDSPSKNIDNNSSRLPLATGHSTPAYQNKDDDNESTCTSIRNFMGDILSCEEMPASEARIVRELIEEQADVLDESLDDHWLDDSSQDEFDINFSISPFATPRSVKNDHYYSPRSITEEKRREINYLTSKNIMEKLDKSEIPRKYDMPLLEDMENSNGLPIGDETRFAEGENAITKIEQTLESPHLDNSIPSEVEDLVTENSISSTFKTRLLTDLAVKKKLAILDTDSNLDVFDDAANDLTTKDNEMCVVLNQGIAKVCTPLTNELEFYVNKAELKRNISAKDNKEYHCTIDKNLEIALNSKASKKALDQLITSPAASLCSGMSTPTIKNILFGDKNTKTDLNSVSTPQIDNILFGKDLQKPHKYFSQVGQNIDDNYTVEDIIDNDAKLEPIESYTSNECDQSLKGKSIKENNEHLDVLEEFLSKANASPMNDSLLQDIIDPIDLSDEHLFKRPMTPPHDKYDLEKGLCKICDKKFSSSKALKIHFAVTHKYKFPSKDPHRNKAQNEKSKVCEVCGNTVKGAANFSRHMRSHQDKNVGFFQCDYCTLFFNTKLALQLHMRMHMGKKKQKKRFECHLCGKLSGNSSHLKLHLRRHSKAISHTCDICHKGYYTRYDLKLHMRCHNHESPFACQHCDKTFKRRGELNLHMKRHLGKFDFRCEVCNKEFVTKALLARHFTTQLCITNRENASQKPSKRPQVRYGKGSIENIRKMMKNSTTEMNIESDIDPTVTEPSSAAEGPAPIDDNETEIGTIKKN